VALDASEFVLYTSSLVDTSLCPAVPPSFSITTGTIFEAKLLQMTSLTDTEGTLVSILVSQSETGKSSLLA